MRVCVLVAFILPGVLLPWTNAQCADNASTITQRSGNISTPNYTKLEDSQPPSCLWEFQAPRQDLMLVLRVTDLRLFYKPEGKNKNKICMATLRIGDYEVNCTKKSTECIVYSQTACAATVNTERCAKRNVSGNNPVVVNFTTIMFNTEKKPRWFKMEYEYAECVKDNSTTNGTALDGTGKKSINVTIIIIAAVVAGLVIAVIVAVVAVVVARKRKARRTIADAPVYSAANEAQENSHGAPQEVEPYSTTGFAHDLAMTDDGTYESVDNGGANQDLAGPSGYEDIPTARPSMVSDVVYSSIERRPDGHKETLRRKEKVSRDKESDYPEDNNVNRHSRPDSPHAQ